MKSHLSAPALVLVAGLARPASAQQPPYVRTPPISTVTNVNVADPDVSEKAPRAAAIRGSGANAIVLFAVTRKGLSERLFVRVPGQVDAGWGDWIHRGAPSTASVPPAGWRRSLPATAGWAGQGTDAFGFLDVPTGAGSEPIAIAHLGNYAGTPPMPTTFEFKLQDPGSGTGGVPAERFNSRTVLTDSGSDQLDVFGTSDDVGATTSQTPLLRLHGSRGANGWTFTPSNLGLPSISLNGTQANVTVGPQAGATFLLGAPAVATHLVFVKAGLRSEDHVTFVTGPAGGGPFSWGIDLGSPQTGALIVDEPLALSYHWESFTRVCVFATVYDRTARRYGLFERHFDTKPGKSPSDPAAWTAWQSFGAPAGLAATTKFRLTTAATWLQGSTLRINLFGYADGDQTAYERGVEFYWDGGSWQWGTLRVPPNGVGFRTSNAVLLQSAGYTRITVFGRTGGDSSFPGSGSIWEMYWTSENGVDYGWAWRDLSWESRITRIPF